MARKAGNGEVCEVTLELHNYESFDEFIQKTNWKKSLQKDKWRSENVNVPVEMSASDFGITSAYPINAIYSSGDDSWSEYTYMNTFGIKEHEMVNTEVFDKDMPWTVWLSGDKDHRPKWCGRLFKTEAEAQAWLDDNQNISE